MKTKRSWNDCIAVADETWLGWHFDRIAVAESRSSPSDAVEMDDYIEFFATELARLPGQKSAATLREVFRENRHDPRWIFLYVNRQVEELGTEESDLSRKLTEFFWGFCY